MAGRSGAGRGGLREVVRQFTPNWFTATMGGFIVFAPDLLGTTAAITIATVPWWTELSDVPGESALA